MNDIQLKLNQRRNTYAVKNRIIFPGAVYHLVQRAPGKEFLFLERADYLYMLSLVKKLVAKFKWNIFSFVLMPNHLHFLVRILEENLASGAKHLFQSYAQYFNKKYQRIGPVFCKPFKAFLCINDSYLITISLYIHLNPYKAGLVKEIFGYPWSSLDLFARDKRVNTFVDYKFILSLLSPDFRKARQIYEEMIIESSGLDYASILDKSTYILKFHSQVLKLKEELKTKFISSALKKEVRDINKFKYLRGTKEEKKKIITEMLKEGRKISEISSYLNYTRQQIYRFLNS